MLKVGRTISLVFLNLLPLESSGLSEMVAVDVFGSRKLILLEAFSLMDRVSVGGGPSEELLSRLFHKPIKPEVFPRRTGLACRPEDMVVRGCPSVFFLLPKLHLVIPTTERRYSFSLADTFFFFQIIVTGKNNNPFLQRHVFVVCCFQLLFFLDSFLFTD